MNFRNLATFVILILACQGNASAGMTVEQRLAQLEARTMKLEQQVKAQNRVIQQKNRQIARLEKVYAERPARSSGFGQWWQGVKMSGVVEVEAMASNNADITDGANSDDASDINVATVELGVEAKINNWTTANVVLLWEEEDGGNQDLTVDEATITIANAEVTPFSFTGGRTAVPFGAFETNMVSDPLTLEIGETKETIAMIGFESNGFNGSVYAFNGNLDANGNDDVDNYGINLGWGNDNISLGIGYINDIGDSDGLTDAVGNNAYTRDVGGVAAHASFNNNGFSLIGEYVSATENFNTGALAFNGSGAKPSAWNLEAGYTVENGLAGKETTFAIGHQQTEELAGALAEHRTLATLSVGVYEDTSLSIEVMHEEDYSTAKGGTGDDATTVTAQLAAEF